MGFVAIVAADKDNMRGGGSRLRHRSWRVDFGLLCWPRSEDRHWGKADRLWGVVRVQVHHFFQQKRSPGKGLLV